MTGVKMRGGVLAAIALCLATPVVAAEKPAKVEKIPRFVLAEAARAAPAGRGVNVVVGQAELGSNINPSMATVALGGGVLGVLIDAKVGNDRAKRAEASITPLRMVLIDFDADQLALDTTKATTAALPWFNGQPADFARDPTTFAKSTRLDAAGEPQVAFFDWAYDTTPDFSSIRVGVRVSLANKDAAGGKPESRLANKKLVYDHTVTSVVQLGNPGEGADNAKRWAANDGALAKKALSVAFAEVGTLIPRALTLGIEDHKRMQAAETRTIGAYRGRLQEEGPGGTLLFNGGLVHVQTLSE